MSKYCPDVLYSHYTYFKHHNADSDPFEITIEMISISEAIQAKWPNRPHASSVQRYIQFEKWGRFTIFCVTISFELEFYLSDWKRFSNSYFSVRMDVSKSCWRCLLLKTIIRLIPNAKLLKLFLSLALFNHLTNM